MAVVKDLKDSGFQFLADAGLLGFEVYELHFFLSFLDRINRILQDFFKGFLQNVTERAKMVLGFELPTLTSYMEWIYNLQFRVSHRQGHLYQEKPYLS